ncbi:hypothetical protein AeMF1_014161 [Aphanomyces euteiches]|nr:hypothetical protein AeMF1_014161 [Aphanomyces euteiches]
MELSEVSCASKLISMPAKFLADNTLFPDPTLVPKLATLAQVAQKDILSADVNIVQYAIKSQGTLVILKHNIFDPAYPSFHFAGWMLAIDWALAAREVISFQGDIRSLNVLSASSSSTGSSVNPLEIPVNVAFYIRYACLYVTSIIICVTILASIYLFLNKGYVEGLNLLEVNRVAGIVWIGRTFLFIRTCQQHLAYDQCSDVSDESSIEKATRLFKTFLAAGEVSWLGFVLSDILMVYTAQYTPAYVFKCNFMVWGLAAILSWVSPVTHTATIQRQCTYAHVDYQLVCSSGTIAIGSFSRFTVLVSICVGSIATAYLCESKYVYEPGNWMHHDVYYLDPASAVINGILSKCFSNVYYVLDLKVWRIFVIEEPVEKRKKLEQDGELHLLYAIPLSD